MNQKLYKLPSAIFLAVVFFAANAAAQLPSAPVSNVLNSGAAVRNIVRVPVPVLKLLSFNEKSEQVNGVAVNMFTFGIGNWKGFPNELFAAAPNLPACGSNKNASRTWLTIYDFQTDKAFNSNCGFTKSEDLKSFAFNIESRNPPDCVYITLADRATDKVYKSNAVKTNGRAGKCEIIKP